MMGEVVYARRAQAPIFAAACNAWTPCGGRIIGGLARTTSLAGLAEVDAAEPCAARRREQRARPGPAGDQARPPRPRG